MKPCLILLAWLALSVAGPAAETKRLLILHTNDLHDHVRADDHGLGGLPYVAGYIRQVRAERSDVIVLDAGDVTEKGDLVAFRTHGVMTFEALRRIGYDGVTIGNHEHVDTGYDNLRRFETALGQPLLCLNLLNEDGTTAFTRSRIVEVNGLRVGLIGLIVPQKKLCLDAAASGVALAAEAQHLRRQGVHLVVAVCHESVRNCMAWSRAAPEVGVFVSGHSHEETLAPVVVPETGAYVVQAGKYARWVGRLELEIEPAAQKIVRAAGSLVAMRHDRIPVDAAMLAWVRERERTVAPEAADFVFNNPAELDGFSIARLAAEGWRRIGRAEVAFCHPDQIIRATLPAGAVDVNALFKTGGHRGAESVRVELTGAEIEAYLNALQNIRREPPEWAGFRVRKMAPPQGGSFFLSDLDPGRLYRVIMARLEWESRFLRLAGVMRERVSDRVVGTREIVAVPAGISFTEALHASIRESLAEGRPPQDFARELARRRESAP